MKRREFTKLLAVSCGLPMLGIGPTPTSAAQTATALLSSRQYRAASRSMAAPPKSSV